MAIHPAITITNPTPPRQKEFIPSSSSPLVPPSTTPHRLLYRGSLTLPDSHLFLDGLTFTSAEHRSLLENPLALALESMRGRKTLRLLGTRRVVSQGWSAGGDGGCGDGGWVDFSGGVCL